MNIVLRVENLQFRKFIVVSFLFSLKIDASVAGLRNIMDVWLQTGKMNQEQLVCH
jgi:hypothetical protein